MVRKRTTHRKKVLLTKARQKAIAKASVKYGKIAAKEAVVAAKYSRDLAKKHITKSNIKKAIEASKSLTSKLKTLLHKKKKAEKRITMTYFR